MLFSMFLRFILEQALFAICMFTRIALEFIFYPACSMSPHAIALNALLHELRYVFKTRSNIGFKALLRI